MTQQTGYTRTDGNAPYRQIYRSRYDRKIAGVCGGIAEYFRVDATLVRLAAVVLAIVSGGTAILAYIVAMILMPDTQTAPAQAWNAGQQPGWHPNQPQDTP
ncbi:MAG TPA: PspC domain-containing protein [Micromonosporaceae bacterium]|nr:PspC domain-containing protein [Micromonosporaceae bacterium]